MANKRIELEHYKYFVRLGDEEPNRKRVTTGAYIGNITIMVMTVFFLVLGMLSASLAKNPKNILEKPPSATPAMPLGDVSIDKALTAQATSGEVTIPDTGGEVTIPDTGGEVTIPDTATEGQVDVQGGTVPVDTTSGTLPADQAKTKKVSGPDKQTKGIGNLSNLAKLAGGRGLQIYFLIISIGMLVLLYFPLKRIKQHRKAP